MPKTLNLVAAIVVAALPLAPCMAQEYIVGPLPTVETSRSTVIEVNRPRTKATSSTEVVAVGKGVEFDFKERLSNLQAQIDKGLDKGWLQAGQAAAFSTERSRLLGATNDAESAGWPKPQTDQLEKDVTAFSASVTTAMSKETVGTPGVIK
jgi:hypothetical protein